MASTTDSTRKRSSRDEKFSLRISNIPSAINQEALERVLEGLTVSAQDPPERAKRPHQSNIRKIVLAPSPSSLSSSRYQVAVVNFNSVPAELESLVTDSEAPDVYLTVRTEDGECQITVDAHFHGLTPLNNSPTPLLDIVAVTGLAGHAFGSWRSCLGSDMWLRDFIPDDLLHEGHKTRVLTYGYDTRLKGTTSTATMCDISKQFLLTLRGARGQREESHRPIIFIGHSLGGLVIKQALGEAYSNMDDIKNRDILKSCYAILFFGVPNKGLDITQLIPMVEGQLKEQLVRDLGCKSQYLQLLDQQCSSIFRKEQTKVICFYEMRQTPTIKKNINTGCWERMGPGVLMVSQESAVHSAASERLDCIPLDGNHSTLVKFSGRSDQKYEMVLEKLSELAAAAQEVVKGRFSTLIDQGRMVEKRRKVLKWLSPIDFEATHKRHFKKHFRGTGQWLLEDPEFRTWEDIHESILLWCYGMPGAGKTVLASLVVETLLAKYELSDNIGVSFVYCNYKEPHETETYIKVAIKQLSRRMKELPIELETLYGEHYGNASNPGYSELQGVFTGISKYFDKVFFVLDGLDECTDGQKRELFGVLRGVVTHPITGHGVVKLFVTSRKERDIKLAFGVFPVIEIEARTVDEDIKLYVTAQLDQYLHDGTLSLRDISLKQKILTTLIGEARGMFLWVEFQLKHICSQTSDYDIEEALKELPGDIEQTYERIILLINKKPEPQRKLARRVLMWIAYARRPLLVEELLFAVVIEDDTRDSKTLESRVPKPEILLGVCANMVVFDVSPDNPYDPYDLRSSVRFVHSSAQEFLFKKILDQDNSSAVATLNIAPNFAHAEMARMCITCMLYCRDSWYEYISFAFYAWDAWGYHVRALTEISESLMKLILEYFEFGVLLEYECGSVIEGKPMTYIFRPADGPKLPLTNLALISDLPLVLRHLEKCHHDQWNPKEQYAMHYAARQNSFKAIEQLCGQGFNVNGLDNDGCTPLFYATSRDVAQSLLDMGADVNIQGWKFGSALEAAVYRDSKEVVLVLLGNGADVNAQGGLFGNVLQAALSRGSKEVVLLLLGKGADVNIQGGFYGNALQAAVVECSNDTVQMLLGKGADVNAQGGYFGNALQAAMVEGRKEMVQMLLCKGADVDAQGGKYGNLLQAAVVGGSKETVQMLLGKGVDVNAQGGVYGNALQAAAVEGSKEMIQLLLRKGADVNAEGGGYGSALQAAVCSGRKSKVQLLLDKGADVNAEGGKYGSALLAATANRNKEIAQLLLDNGATEQHDSDTDDLSSSSDEGHINDHT